MRWLLPNRAMWAIAAIIIATLAACAVIVPRLGLSFPLRDALQPVAVVAGLAALAVWYERRGVQNLALCFRSVVALVAFSTCYSVLMCAVAAVGRPLADEWLNQIDGALGLSAANIVRWTNERPTIARLLWLAYFSIIPQTIVTIIYLGMRHEHAALEKFLTRFMVTALLTAGGLYFAPAIGSCAAGDYAPPDFHTRFVEQMSSLRAGQLREITWRDAEGLITFPSFHTIWGVLVVLAFSQRRRLFWPVLSLNLAMIASTVTTGMHYFVDVLAGFLVVAIALPVADWLSHGDGFSHAWFGPRRARELVDVGPSGLGGQHASTAAR